jgi:7-cyano-7-deazaguanine synthase in queuosine biosynthesis
MTLVCWSGGCDSTLALYETAKAEGGKASAVSVVHKNIKGAEESKAARAKLLRRLKRLGLTIQHTTVTIDHAGDFDVGMPGGTYQPGIWLGAAMQFLEAEDDLCFGYIRGDDFWHRRAAFETAFRELQGMREGRGQVRFPLEWDTKADVIRRLQELKLYSACWWCENPEGGRRCRKCVPCLTHEAALWRIERDERRRPKGKPLTVAT